MIIARRPGAGWEGAGRPCPAARFRGDNRQAMGRLGRLEGNFGAHSLRSGFVTDAGKRGVPRPAVMAMTEQPFGGQRDRVFSVWASQRQPCSAPPEIEKYRVDLDQSWVFQSTKLIVYQFLREIALAVDAQ